MDSVQRMEITLRYLADPDFQTGGGFEVGVHQSTVSRAIAATVTKITEQAPNWIQFPTSLEEASFSKEEWSRTLGFPACIGAIDCTHVRIEKPGNPFGDEYINRNNIPSINVQATCDGKRKFTSIDASWPGSVHDSRVFKNSPIYEMLSNGHYNSLLLGDSGYGIAPFMMTPFDNPITPVERRYNVMHARNRVLIEQSFGILKRRFPILRYGVMPVDLMDMKSC